MRDGATHERQAAFTGKNTPHLNQPTSRKQTHSKSSKRKTEAESSENPLLQRNSQLESEMSSLKQELMKHQEKAAFSEMNVLEALMNMKQQIQQVVENTAVRSQEDDSDQLPSSGPSSAK